MLPEVEALLASVALSGSARCPLHCELMMAATAGAGTERVLLEGTLQLRLLDVSDPCARDGATLNRVLSTEARFHLNTIK